MSKKAGIIVVLLFSLAVVVVWYGMGYANEQKEKLFAGQTGSAAEQEIKNPDTAAQLSDYESRRDNLSFFEYLSFLQLQKKNLSISFYGELEEKETWTSEVENYINEQMDHPVTTSMITYPSPAARQLKNEDTLEALAATESDVVFFLLPARAGQESANSTESAAGNIEDSYAGIKERLPETFIVFVSPHPLNEESTGESASTDKKAYLVEQVSVIEENEWVLFDLHESFLNKVETDELVLEKTLLEDEKTLNEEGSAIYSSLFNAELHQRMNTTDGI